MESLRGIVEVTTQLGGQGAEGAPFALPSLAEVLGQPISASQLTALAALTALAPDVSDSPLPARWSTIRAVWEPPSAEAGHPTSPCGGGSQLYRLAASPTPGGDLASDAFFSRAWEGRAAAEIVPGSPDPGPMRAPAKRGGSGGTPPRRSPSSLVQASCTIPLYIPFIPRTHENPVLSYGACTEDLEANCVSSSCVVPQLVCVGFMNI